MWPARETLPPLDCHAHIAPDVTLQQVAGLEGAQVFAMTRTLAQAALVAGRRDLGLVWGLGVHPGDPVARAAFDVATLTGLLDRFTLIGEIGLDRRGGDLARQQQIFDEILSSVRGHPVLLSLHSTGAIDEVLEVLTQRSGRGAILHWFTGNASQVGRAAALGCYFSVNAAMSDEQLARIPPDRMLPEEFVRVIAAIAEDAADWHLARTADEPTGPGRALGIAGPVGVNIPGVPEPSPSGDAEGDDQDA